MEEEEEYHNPVDTAKAIASDEVEAEDTTNMIQAAQQINDCRMLSATACSTTVRIRLQIKQDYHGITSCNTPAQVTSNT